MIKDCDLISRVKWITDAVASQDLGTGALSSYLLRNGNIHATDGRMTVGTPFPFDGPDCLIPAEQFEKVLINRPDGDFTWEFEHDRLVLHRGRFKGRIKLIPLDSWVMPTELLPNLTPIPDGMLYGLLQLLPFVSDNATKPWATCIAMIGDYLYASNNIAVARIFCPTHAGVDEFLLPRWVADFVTKRETGLTAWANDEQRVCFLWDDGSWMRSSLILEKYPPVQSILDKYFQGDVDVEITEPWRKVLHRIARIADDPVVRLRVDECAGSTGEVLSVEDDASTPVPEGKIESVWDLRYLLPVIDIATHWNPRTHPSPAPWRGDGIEGIISGRRD